MRCAVSFAVSQVSVIATIVTLSTRTGEMDDGFPEVKLHQCKGLRMTQRLRHPVLPSSPTLKQMFCRRMYNVSEFWIFLKS